MFTRKDLKKSSRTNLRFNYWRAVIVCVVLAFFAGAYDTISSGGTTDVLLEMGTGYGITGNVEQLRSFVQELTGQDPVAELSDAMTATNGILAGVINSSTKAGSFLFGVLNAVNQFVFGDRIMEGVLILVGAAIMFLYWMFVGNVLRVGECRFFLENRCYHSTRVNNILFIYKVRRTRRVAFAMFCKTFFVVLWSFTIVGGFVKFYAYRMVPYILAENPDVKRRDAFKLSMAMMKGNKWRAFLLDASFWGWSLLSIPTFGLLNAAYVNPYKAGADAEFYVRLRYEYQLGERLLHEVMTDKALYVSLPNAKEPGEYPEAELPIPVVKRAWLTTDYHRRYSLTSVVLLFFSFCFIGWVWEVFVDLFNTGHFVNRGTLYGPWLPIYGCGGVLAILLLRRWVDNPIVTFFVAMGFCGVMEYFTGWLLETMTGKVWWDYTGYFLNINGRVCLEGLLVFGLGCSVGIYFLAPALDDIFQRIPKQVKNVLCVALVLCFLVDLGISLWHPNTAASLPATGSAGTSSSAAAPAPGRMPLHLFMHTPAH